MTAPTLLLIFLVVLIGFILIGRHYERQLRQTEIQQAVARISYGFEEMARAIGEQLTPAVLQATQAFHGFAEAIRRKDES